MACKTCREIDGALCVDCAERQREKDKARAMDAAESVLIHAAMELRRAEQAQAHTGTCARQLDAARTAFDGAADNLERARRDG